jgi:hypothetical protein
LNFNIVLKIGNEGTNPCIDPIQEVNSFDIENNESFLHENNYLFKDLTEDNTCNSFENNSTTLPLSDIFRSDNTASIEESELWRIRRNIMSLRASKLKDLNRSDFIGNEVTFKKKIFAVQNLSSNELSTNNINRFISSNNNNSLNCNKDKLNQSCNLSLNNETSKKRGRKKLLFEGIKTEIIDKAFLREFKSYLKKSKSLKNIYEDLKPDEKIFWNEFIQANSPPFSFTLGSQRIEYKSFSKNLLRHIFSYHSVRYLYVQFIKERGKDIINSIVNKKIKKVDRKMMIFYHFYGTNLYRLYSNENSDINLDEFSETMLSTSGLMNTCDLFNTSI